MTGLGESGGAGIGASVGNGAGPGGSEGGARWPAPPWKFGVRPSEDRGCI